VCNKIKRVIVPIELLADTEESGREETSPRTNMLIKAFILLTGAILLAGCGPNSTNDQGASGSSDTRPSGGSSSSSSKDTSSSSQNAPRATPPIGGETNGSSTNSLNK
jgi:hypothetical protein